MNVKLISYFLVFIMVGSAIVYIGASTQEQTQPTPQPTKEYEGYFNVQGKIVYKPFDSIEDALNITPPGILYATFINCDKAKNSVLENFSLHLTSPLYTYYLSNVKRTFNAYYQSGDNIKMDYIRPKGIHFSWTGMSTYRDYVVFNRTNPKGYTVVGDPIIFSQNYSLLCKAIDLIEDYNETSGISEFSRLFKIVNVLDNASYPIEVVGKYGDNEGIYYLGVRGEGERAVRKAYYPNPTPELLDNIRKYRDKAIENGTFESYQVSITDVEGTKVAIVTIVSENIEKVVLEPAI
jgi:hypothetical protein